mgnify:CR=1 FL=1
MRRVQGNQPVCVLVIDFLDVETLQDTAHAMTYHIILGACYAGFEQTEFKVVLKEVGGNKICVIKVIKEATGLGLVESKALAENGKVIKESATKEEADAMIAKFKEAGAEVVAE